MSTTPQPSAKRSHVIVTGPARKPGDEPELRRDIQDLVQDDKQWSLYVQAVDRMMKDTGPLSWYSIGGIHGAPAVPWEEVEGHGKPMDKEFDYMGYCHHASVLFPTWHRAYLLLFEQSLVSFAVQIAEEYSGHDDAAEWRHAASSLRSPFWDWATHDQLPDKIFKAEQLKITLPTGSTHVPNPLLGYKFKSELGEDADHERRPSTVRSSNKARPHESDCDALQVCLKTLDNEDLPMRHLVYETLCDTDGWDEFSNKKMTKSACINSLEVLHNTIHTLVGGSGHMGSTRVAAFDPVFWLHHTNVDRLFALWQVLHPDQWVTEGKEGEQGSFAVEENTAVNEHTDLKPFWNSEDTFYKSSSPGIRDWEQLGYTYPDFARIPDDANRKASIESAVVRMYYHDFVQRKKQPLDWLARIRTRALAMPCSFSVLLFFGEPAASESEWRKADNFIGLHAEFINPDPDQCANCIANLGVLTEGFVDLTRAVHRRTHHRSDEEIEKYIKDHLRWRIQQVDGKVVDPANVPGLEIRVMTVPLEWSNERSCWKKRPKARPSPCEIQFAQVGGRPLPEDQVQEIEA